MKQTINFLRVNASTRFLTSATLIITGWVLAFIVVLLWAGVQKSKLQQVNVQMEAIQAKNKIVKNKIQAFAAKNQPIIQKSDGSIAPNAKYSPIDLTEYLNQISDSYVRGTTIDYIHIQDGQKIRIEGRALHAGLVKEIVDNFSPFEESALKIKVKSISPQTQHVVFSIETE